MSSTLGDTPEMVELRFERHKGQLKVTAPDKHIMILPVEAAAQACRALTNLLAFNDQFHLLLPRLAEWLQDRQSFLKMAYLTVCDTGLLFVVVQNGQQYSRDLEDELTKLDLEIANDTAYDAIRFDVLALPNAPESSVKSFLSADPKHTLRYPLNG